jgi:hypothetical protein
MAGIERRARIASVVAFAAVPLLTGCPKDDKPGVVTVDAGITMAPPQVAAPTCLPCTGNPPTGWFFYKQFADAQCKQPIAQAMFDSCADVTVPAQIDVTFADAWGRRKYLEAAKVEKVAEVASTTGVYRLNEAGCVPADSAPLKLAPAACSGKKVCRTEAGELACDGCRTLPNGCPAYEPSLVRVVFEDKGTPAAGGGGGTNVARLKQCCNQLAIQAKAMPNSPEGGLFQQAAAQCNAMASSLGPNVNAPELGALKTLLAGRNIPAICAGF